MFAPTALSQIQERVIITPASQEEVRYHEAVFIFLHDYFSALAQGEVTKLATYHPCLTSPQVESLRSYFAHTIRDLHISLQDVRVHLAAHIATVSFQRTDRFVDRLTSRPVEKSIRLSTTLVRDASGWRLLGPDLIMSAPDGADGHGN
jgi:hypothetical protein